MKNITLETWSNSIIPWRTAGLKRLFITSILADTIENLRKIVTNITYQNYFISNFVSNEANNYADDFLLYHANFSKYITNKMKIEISSIADTVLDKGIEIYNALESENNKENIDVIYFHYIVDKFFIFILDISLNGFRDVYFQRLPIDISDYFGNTIFQGIISSLHHSNSSFRLNTSYGAVFLVNRVLNCKIVPCLTESVILNIVRSHFYQNNVIALLLFNIHHHFDSEKVIAKLKSTLNDAINLSRVYFHKELFEDPRIKNLNLSEESLLERYHDKITFIENGEGVTLLKEIITGSYSIKNPYYNYLQDIQGKILRRFQLEAQKYPLFTNNSTDSIKLTDLINESSIHLLYRRSELLGNQSMLDEMSELEWFNGYNFNDIRLQPYLPSYDIK